MKCVTDLLHAIPGWAFQVGTARGSNRDMAATPLKSLVSEHEPSGTR